MAEEEKKTEEEKVEEPQEKSEDKKEEIQETEKKEDQLPEDPHEMTPGELDKAEDEMIDDETGEIKEPEKEPEKKEEKEEESEKEPEKEPEKKFDADGNEITGDPLRDTQASLQRERDKRIEAERKLKEERFKGFEKLNDEDEDILKDEDPEGFLVYKESEKDYDKHKGELLDDDINTAHSTNRDSVIKFMSGQMELDPDKPGDQEKIISYLRNPESKESKMMLKLDNFLSTNVKPVKVVKVSETDAIPVYTSEQLNLAYKTVYHDEIVTNKEKQVREATITKMEEASKGGSHFDRLGKSEDKAIGQKKIDDYTQDELYLMSEDELDLISKQVDTG